MWKSPNISISVFNIYRKPVDQFKASKFDNRVQVHEVETGFTGLSPYTEAFPDVTTE